MKRGLMDYWIIGLLVGASSAASSHQSINPSIHCWAMLIFDQLKKDDPQLRAVALAVLVGLCVLLAGLWWVQIVSVKDFQAHLEMQSFRTVRMPAVRGKILDRNGVVL